MTIFKIVRFVMNIDSVFIMNFIWGISGKEIAMKINMIVAVISAVLLSSGRAPPVTIP